jgi:hypothetical protein
VIIDRFTRLMLLREVGSPPISGMDWYQLRELLRCEIRPGWTEDDLRQVDRLWRIYGPEAARLLVAGVS